MVEFSQVEYRGWSECYQLSNGIVDLVITGQIGPRLIRFGFVDDDNLFFNNPDQVGKTGGDDWRIYGGHRFWHAPEEKPRTYYPDNAPVTVSQQEGFIRVAQPVEETTGIIKELDIYMADDAAHVRIVHRLKNAGVWPIACAPWALSVMAAGGTGIVPLPPRGSHAEHLLPTNTLTLWAYTDMSDPRWTWGERYVLLRQDSTATAPQKAGYDVKEGWAAYARDGQLFVKRFQKQPDGIYPDLGCVVETFTNKVMLELETLGPIEQLAPNGTLEHTENWFLFKEVSTPTNDSEVDEYILPKVRETDQHL